MNSKSQAKASSICSVINKWSQRIRWIETAYSEGHNITWMNGGFVPPNGWAYLFGGILYPDREAAWRIFQSGMKNLELPMSDDVRNFFDDLWEVCLPDSEGRFLEAVDVTEGRIST